MGKPRASAVLSFGLVALATACGSTQVVDFEDVGLDAESAWTGPVADGVVVDDGFGGSNQVGLWPSGAAHFINRFSLTWGSWSGFSVSNQSDTTTPGFENDTSAITGKGAGESGNNYAVAFGVVNGLDAADASQLEQLPYVVLPPNTQPVSAQVTNTTYAALSMRDGDSFAKKFGGESGDDPDFFRLAVYGTSQGTPLPDSVELYLADFRDDDPAKDYILQAWAPLDLTQLSGADRLYFNLNSSDIGDFGMSTPAYFAIDEILLTSRLREDITGDGRVSVDDIDTLCDGLASNSNDPALDFNGDGRVGEDDLQAFLNATQHLRGDADFDGEVQFRDFLQLADNFGEWDKTWSDGDFNCDGQVAFGDFLQLADNFERSGGATTVPEPGGFHLSLLACLALLSKRRSCPVTAKIWGSNGSPEWR